MTPSETSTDVFAKCFRFRRDLEAQEGGYYWIFRALESGQGPEVMIDERSMIMLGSNSYLDLTTHPRVMAAAREALERYGTGTAGSRHLNGNLALHEKLERRLAEFLGKEAACVFSTGYQTNLGAIQALIGRGELAVVDKTDHASILDGCNLAQGRMARYRHNDLEHLESILKKESGSPLMIIVDGVFSMEGDLVDLPGLVELARRYGARIYLDDAHGLGVMGPEGQGTAAHFGLTEEVDLIMGTFSKSLACIGGFVAGDERPISWIKHLGRSSIFSAGLPASLTATALAALEVIREEPERRARLWRNRAQWKSGLDRLGFDTGPSETPIVPVYCGDIMRLAGVIEGLTEAGIFANPVIPPAVPPGREMIRTSVLAGHTEAQLDRALELTAGVGRTFGLID